MITQEDSFLKNNTPPKKLLILDVAFALFYFGALIFFFQKGMLLLWVLLMLGEIFHVWQALTFISTVWETEYQARRDDLFIPDVDVFISVAGEPIDVIEKTARAAQKMRYPGNFRISILNDGYVAKRENWHDVELLAQQLGIDCITRRVPGGAKAGNINHALLLTQAPFIVFFDSDHAPEENFLVETIPYLTDARLAFVQTPQFYENYGMNAITRGAWEQQTLFFGAICKGKNRLNSVPMCGTNMVVRRTALEDVGGMCETSIAEDFVTGFFMHKRGWRSLYIPKILARGLAPEDFHSYYKQQERWVRGSLDLIFQHNLLFARGLTMSQRLQYLSSVSYFLSGWVVLIDASLPIIFFLTGLFPVQNSTMALALIFLPYLSLMMYTIQRCSNFSFSYRALAFSISGFDVQIKASISSFFRKKMYFSVTSKKAQKGTFLNLASAQITYVLLAAVTAAYSLVHAGGIVSAAWVANAAWATVNCLLFLEYIKAASTDESAEPFPQAEIDAKKVTS